MGLSQEKLAERINVSRNCIQQLECHEHIPLLTIFLAIIEALDLDQDDYIRLMLDIRSAFRQDNPAPHLSALLREVNRFG